MYAPKTENSKRTSAFLRAPSKEAAEKLLEQGHLIDNGHILAVVPSNSTPAEEDERTVLLLGINKVSKAMWNRAESLSEQALLKALVKANYPVQALHFVELEGEGRIGHAAFVLLKHPRKQRTLSLSKTKQAKPRSIGQMWQLQGNMQEVLREARTLRKMSEAPGKYFQIHLGRRSWKEGKGH